MGITRKHVEGVVLETVRETCAKDVPGEKIVLGASYTADLGLDSLDTLDIALELEEYFSGHGFRGFSDRNVSNLNTPQKTADYIMERIRRD